MNFTERYRKLSNTELLEVIANYKSYQPLAVETAKKEIENRNLSYVEIQKIELEIETRKQNAQKIVQIKKEKKKKINTVVLNFFDAINPIQNGIQTTEKTIRVITLLFGGISIYRILKEFGMLHFMITDSNARWDITMLEYFLPLIILPIAIILFWKRKKTGWILLSIFLTYSSINTIILFFMNFGRKPTWIPAFDSVFPTVSPITYLSTLFFFCGFLWIISKNNIRETYQITKKKMFQIIGFTILINLTFFYFIIS